MRLDQVADYVLYIIVSFIKSEKVCTFGLKPCFSIVCITPALRLGLLMAK